MKNLLLACALLLSVSLFAQKEAKLSITNPQPRVNQEVEVTLNISFITDDIEEQLDKSDDIEVSDSYFGLPDGTMKKTVKFKKAGSHSLGPIEFRYNGEQYVSNAIVVNVAEELPMEEGIWVRVAQFDGQQFLIIETMTKNKQSADKESVTTTYTGQSIPGMYGEKEGQLMIDQELDEDVSFESRRTSTSTVRPEGSDYFSGPSFSYHRALYEIHFANSFSGTFKLTKKHFKNIPKGMKVPNVQITR